MKEYYYLGDSIFYIMGSFLKVSYNTEILGNFYYGKIRT